MLALSSSLSNMWRERNMWHHSERVGRRSGSSGETYWRGGKRKKKLPDG